MGINLLALKLIIIDCHATWYAIQEKWSQWFLNMILISLELASWFCLASITAEQASRIRASRWVERSERTDPHGVIADYKNLFSVTKEGLTSARSELSFIIMPTIQHGLDISTPRAYLAEKTGPSRVHAIADANDNRRVDRQE